MGTIAKVTAGGATHYIASTAYCICSTAANTVAKVANLIGDQADNASTAAFTLIKGSTVHVKFTYSNTASNPTLNVAGTGAKAIMRYGTTNVGTNVAASWVAGAVVPFTYDGTNWIQNSAWDNNANTWRGIQNNLTSTSTSDSLSANQGRILNENKVDKTEPTYSIDKTASSGTEDGDLYAALSSLDWTSVVD